MHIGSWNVTYLYQSSDLENRVSGINPILFEHILVSLRLYTYSLADTLTLISGISFF